VSSTASTGAGAARSRTRLRTVVALGQEATPAPPAPGPPSAAAVGGTLGGAAGAGNVNSIRTSCAGPWGESGEGVQGEKIRAYCQSCKAHEHSAPVYAVAGNSACTHTSAILTNSQRSSFVQAGVQGFSFLNWMKRAADDVVDLSGDADDESDEVVLVSEGGEGGPGLGAQGCRPRQRRRQGPGAAGGALHPGLAGWDGGRWAGDDGLQGGGGGGSAGAGAGLGVGVAPGMPGGGLVARGGGGGGVADGAYRWVGGAPGPASRSLGHGAGFTIDLTNSDDDMPSLLVRQRRARARAAAAAAGPASDVVDLCASSGSELEAGEGGGGTAPAPVVPLVVPEVGLPHALLSPHQLNLFVFVPRGCRSWC
jgi:hypothetical protein